MVFMMRGRDSRTVGDGHSAHGCGRDARGEGSAAKASMTGCAHSKQARFLRRTRSRSRSLVAIAEVYVDGKGSRR
jgi:hypothetical protein